MSNSLNKIYAKLPKAGLGNKMLVWARAFVAAQEQGLELFVSPWWGISPGAWIRLEKKKRLYLNYFKEDGIWKRWKLYRFKKTAEVIVEPVSPVASRPVRTLYVFQEMFVDKDFFKPMKPYRLEVREGIYRMLTQALSSKLQTYAAPEIGIHVRRGDFKKGSTLTPEDFFVNTIRRIREICGRELGVTVFTDAEPSELPLLYALPGIKQAEAKEDILDILLLGQSRILILSISSTFSFWGAFLCDGIVIRHPQEWHPAVRPDEINQQMFEGNIDLSHGTDPALKAQLLKISNE